MKRVLVLLAALLVCMGAAAAAETYKDEVVYALLTPSGEVTGIYVINAFEADEPDEVTDYGAYDQVINLTGSDELSYQDGAVTLSLPKGRTFYQGDMAAKDLPWQIKIIYTLDGAVVTPDQLPGAQGHLTLTLSARPTPGLEAYASGATLQITVMLDAGKALNIVAEKATSAWSGKTRTMAFVILPGASAAYEISADVTDFSMAGIQMAGVRMAMDAEMYEEMARVRFEGTLLADMAGNAISSFLGDMQKAPVVSFADVRNAVRSVQFVMLTQEIPVKSPEDTVEKEANTDTPWTRLAALFGG